MILGIDVGGTFTDAVLLTPGAAFTAKTLSTDPQSEGVLAAAQQVLERAGAAPAEVSRFVHGMTVATNALLERRGARTVLVTTEGFRDLLTIGRQERLSLYTLFPERVVPLVDREDCLTVAERSGPDGVEKALSSQELERVVRKVAEREPQAVAVCLLWSFRHPEHEERLAAALRAALPGVPVVSSGEIAPLFREFERFSTAVLDAYVTPRTGGYLDRLGEGCAAVGLPKPEIMTSSGGTAPHEQARRHGARLLLSGPAGGVRAGAALARGLGYGKALTFDMGGTSTDCAAVDLRDWRGSGVALPTSTERQVAGFPCRLPMVDIHTVSAGGGSIAEVDPGGALKVGPQSAGADPGPACYGRGGLHAAVTDANLVLGRIRPDRPFAGTLSLVPEAAGEAIGRLATEADLGQEEAAEGVLRVGVFNMAAALRKVTLERGLDPREYVLLAFGGAGGLHACELAEEIGVTEVLLPLRAGAFSAEGLAAAPARFDRTASLLWDLGTLTEEEWQSQWAQLEEAVARDLAAALGGGELARSRPQGGSEAALDAADQRGVDPEDVDYRWEVEARYAGQAYELGMVVERKGGRGLLRAQFHRLHQERFGYAETDGKVEVIAARVVAEVRLAQAEAEHSRAREAQRQRRPRLRREGGGPLYANGGWREVPYFEITVAEADEGGDAGAAGEALLGPLLLSAEQYSGYVPSGWQVASLPGALRLSRLQPAEDPEVSLANPEPSPAGGSHFGPVDLELAVGTFHSLAEEMGTSLVRSARSANIKERRDSSAALLDAHANLVVQAEHIPVHLGALPASVAAIGELPQAQGDVWVLNDPYRGGTHLPDITMAAPWYSGGEVVGFVANRAHHADVGGAYPGSMPATSTSLFAEGLVIPPVRLEWEGRLQEDVLDLILANTRRPEERRADLMAQAAAVRLGLSRLSRLEQERGESYVRRAFAEVRSYSLKRAAASLLDLRTGVYRGCDLLESEGLEHLEAPISIPVEVRISAEELLFDFQEAPDAIAGNLNCSRAVTVSACLFFARALLDPSPFGAAGCQALVRVLTRPGSLLDARTPHAVAGGNVETSQRVVDAILDALGEPLGLPAASQGTMNNLALGGASYTYYETLAGGGGASAEGAGTDAIHSGMTNTLNTPIEALERDFPLRVERYEIREDSGGAGRYRGGEGLVRSFRVVEGSSLSLLTERRRFPPPGRAGGKPGEVGRCLVNGREVPAKGEHRLQPGDTFTLETPGGGGWGEPGVGKEAKRQSGKE